MTTTEFKDSTTTQNDESQHTTSSSKKRGIRIDVGLQQQDRETFYKNLLAFNERRNTPIVRMPKIGGEVIDLHKLYTDVTNRGGWLKVNARNEWEDILSEMGVSLKCVNAVVAIKQLYCRHLDKYEKAFYLGEDPDRVEEPDDDDRQSRHKKWSEKSTPIVPMSYNYLQHNVTEQARVANKMSTNLYKNSEYEKILLSLMSPLPNEQDFAINVCTLMANESKNILKIENCPKLLDTLLAHTGVYCHSTMREIFEETYTKTRKHSLQTFWNDLLYLSSQILNLSFEDCLSTNNKVNKNNDCEEIFEDGLNAESDEEDKIDLDKLDFLSLGRGLGTREYVGQRIQQISSIIRNLSFFEENLGLMAKNRTLLRFLIMCSNIRWGNLHHMALDVCGNIASEIDLFDPKIDEITRCLVFTLCEGIQSQDRGVIISCLEILNKLSQRETNEDYLLKLLDHKLYSQICLYLSLNDIMLLLYSLECIYGLSSLGANPCNAFIQVKGIVDLLVSLITVEAQSYGPDGCILMRVVETVPGNMLPMVAQNIANLQNVSLGQLKQPQQSQNSIMQNENSPKATTSQIPIQNKNITVSQQQQITANINTNISKPNLLQQPTSQENEQFAISWLTAILESAPLMTNRIEQQELYKLYTAAIIKNGKRGTVPQTHFPRIVRSIFGTNIGPTMLKTTDQKGVESNMFFYVNLKLRANPLPLRGVQQVSQPVQQNNQPSQINQIQNKLINPTASSNNSITSQSTNETTSKDLVNNLNAEVGSKEIDIKISSIPTVSSTVISQLSNNNNHINNPSNNTLATVQNNNAIIASKNINCNKNNVFLQPQPSVIIRKEVQKIDQLKGQIQQQPAQVSVVQKVNKIDIHEKGLNTENTKTMEINNSINNSNSNNTNPSNPNNSKNKEPNKVVKQNVIVTNNKLGTNAKGISSSFAKQIVNTNIKQNSELQPSIISNTVVQQQQQIQQNQIGQVQQQQKTQLQYQQQISNQSQQKLQQQQFSTQSQFQQQPNISTQKLEQQSQLIKSQTPQMQQRQQSDINQQQNQQLQSHQKMIGNVIITQHSGQVVTKTTTIGQTQMTTTTHVPSSAGGSTAIIKSLLANKVTTTANNNYLTSSTFTTAPTITQVGSNSNGNISTCAVGAVNTNSSNYLITQNVNLHQLAQRQNLAKQKEVANQHSSSVHVNNINSGHKLSTTTISALVNNPIIQSTPVKVGQTTIKPINAHSIDKKPQIQQVPVENMESSNWEPMPPLAPLGNTTVRSIIVPPSSLSTASEDSCNSIASSAISANHVMLNDDGENSLISFDGLLIPKSKSVVSSIIEDDSSKDSSIKGSQFINANKMLVNLLDKKSPDPPAMTVGIKRKFIDENKSRKKSLIITQFEEPDTQVTPSKNAANLYAEMAASILEDEELEDVIPSSKINTNINTSNIQSNNTMSTTKHQIPQQQQQQPTMQAVIQKTTEPQKQIITMPMHRQIIMSPNNPHQQVIFSQNSMNSQTAQQHQQMSGSGLQQTLKSDSGFQTVPVILQKQIGPGGQQILQPVLQQQQQQSQTQYVLATNPQGQTYLVAQQTHSHSQPQPTVLLAQSSAQGQQSGQTKTIIILQQQGGPPQAVAQQQIIAGGPGQPQKMIMTNPQGQQMIVTQVQRPSMQQIVVNQSGNVLPQNVLLTQTVLPQSNTATQATIQQIQQAAQQSQLSPQLHIQQSILNSQNQTQGMVPQLTSNGTTLQMQQQSSQQQASILSQLPHIPATIKLHTPISNTGVNHNPIIQQQNLNSKVISKPNTSTISIVTQNPVTSQANTVQPQIIQQIVKSTSKVINSPLTKITLQQQPQVNQQSSHQQTIARPQITQQQSIQKTQTALIMQKSQINPNQSQTFQQQKLQHSSQNQIVSTPSLQTQSTTNQLIVQQHNNQQKNLIQQPMSTSASNQQHHNIVQQILAQNPSQTQIIQQSTPVQGTSSIITNQNKIITTSCSSQEVNVTSGSSYSPNNIMNINQNSKFLHNTNQQINTVASNQQNGQELNQTQQSQKISAQNTNNINNCNNNNDNNNNSTNSNNNNSATARNDSSNNCASGTSNNTNNINSQNPPQPNSPAPPPPPSVQKVKNDEDIADINYLYVCDWRNCPRKKYKSVQEIYKHACQIHCPEGLDSGAEIYCQWGVGPGFCDNIPRKRFSLMTHLLDRHCTLESMKTAVQRRLMMGIPQPTHANPVTIIKSNEARGSTASPALSTSSSGSTPSGAVISAAMHAIKRHSNDFINPKELMDENEGPVTKSIRLTAALVLKNLVTYTDKAKRHIRQYEPHLAGVALSNVESSRTISQILYELNN